MSIAIVKYNAGNIYSVVNALRRLGVEPVISNSHKVLAGADKVLLPGQGEAKNAMRYLQENGLDTVIKSLTQPVLGICIGQQILCRHSEEGNTDCLGVFDADVKKFRPQKHEDKVPAMGWNSIGNLKSPLFNNVCEGDFVYFVHSYYVPLCGNTIATADYIQPYSAAMRKNNFFAIQFHPEKSGDIGERIIKNFLEL